jgi:putative transcriptional regulator
MARLVSQATAQHITIAFLIATAVPALAARHDRSLEARCTAPSARLAKGKLLVATADLSDPNFHETVVLLADYGPTGASGLVINRPSRTTLAELLPGEENLRPRNDTIYIGGPVAQDRLILLIRSATKPHAAHRLFDDVYISGSASTLRRLTQPHQAAVFRSYMGYAGWGPGQLESEVERGDWRILPAEAEMIFELPPKSLWRTLIARSSGEWAALDRPFVPANRGSFAVATTRRLGRLAATLAGVHKEAEELAA